MASYGYGAPHHYPNVSSHPHNNHGRGRRHPRVQSQNTHRQMKAQRSPKEVVETPTYSEYLQRLEAAKSFEFDDDEVFCPFHLLTEDDVRFGLHTGSISPTNASKRTNNELQLQSIHSSSSSDRGSLSSGSPNGSPLQHQAQPTPSFYVSSAPHAYNAAFQQQHNMKLHQPMAQRNRINAIAIVDPSTGSVASPPLSVSPGRQMQNQYGSRR